MSLSRIYNRLTSRNALRKTTRRGRRTTPQSYISSNCDISNYESSGKRQMLWIQPRTGRNTSPHRRTKRFDDCQGSHRNILVGAVLYLRLQSVIKISLSFKTHDSLICNQRVPHIINAQSDEPDRSDEPKRDNMTHPDEEWVKNSARLWTPMETHKSAELKRQ